MATKRVLSQSTGRHVIKRTDATNTLENSFGVLGVLGTDTGHTNFPTDIVHDASLNFIYVADTNNKRILKLTEALVFVDQLDVTATVDVPVKLHLSGTDLYVVGISNFAFLSMGKIDVSTFSTVAKSTQNIMTVNRYPLGFSADFTPGDFLVTGVADNLSVITENGTGFVFDRFQTITGQQDLSYEGHLKHTDGNLYMNSGRKLVKVNSSYVNTGDSDRFTKFSQLVYESEVDNTLLVFDTNKQDVSEVVTGVDPGTGKDIAVQTVTPIPSVVRFDTNLNVVETVYSDSGSTLSTDVEEISAIQEFDV